MIDFGLFNDEGLVADGYHTAAEAEKARVTDFHPDDDLTVSEICNDHPDHANSTCEECHAEDEDIPF
jgi:hypothetical protein